MLYYIFDKKNKALVNVRDFFHLMPNGSVYQWRLFLNFKFTLTDLSSSSSHLLIIFPVIIYFILYGLMLSQQTLCFGQRGGRVLGCHGGLCTRQPGLEVIEISEEALKLWGFAQRLLTPLHGGSKLLPHLLDFSQSTLDLLLLLRMLRCQLLGLRTQVIQLTLWKSKGREQVRKSIKATVSLWLY